MHTLLYILQYTLMLQSDHKNSYDEACPSLFNYSPLEEGCECSTCRTHSRAYVHSVIKETSACHLLTVHNVAFQLGLMRRVRTAIRAGTFPDFVRGFLRDNYPEGNYPSWAVSALKAVNVELG